jgi:hypothetical protein
MIVKDLLKDTNRTIQKCLKKNMTKCHLVQQQENITGCKLTCRSRLNTFHIATDWL